MTLLHPGGSVEARRRSRVLRALLRGHRWSRPAAVVRARELAAASLMEAAAEVRRGRGDGRARALLARALRRLVLVRDLDMAP
ncbi:MAG: hypothetical protein F4137_19620 [Acidobacteria bacterium]|nr:hypothetical protein [Acidobacteriota bacterium]